MPARAPFEIGGASVAAGTRATIDMPVSVLSDHTPASMSVHVVHGRKPGPVIFVSAAVHGDEVIGVEISRRLLRTPQLDTLRGTLLVVPIVNAFGFLNHSRYLPDRRDLNRSFPGSAGGSLTSRLAHMFLTEVVSRCEFGIDLHSAAIHRTNLPQIRVSPNRIQTLRLAEEFGAPVVLTAKLREGSLRGEAGKIGVEMLLYEAGEALRFDEMAARAGLSGILRVMRALEMLPAKGISRAKVKPIRSSKSHWLRAPAGGLLRMFRNTGDIVSAGDLLGAVSGPFGEVEDEVLADIGGIIIGRTHLPVVNEGDALYHIAEIPTHSDADAEAKVETLNDQLLGDALFDEDEII
jgi:predicted deacylase